MKHNQRNIIRKRSTHRQRQKISN